LCRRDACVPGVELSQSDGAAIGDETELEIGTHDRAELLLFDLA